MEPSSPVNGTPASDGMPFIYSYRPLKTSLFFAGTWLAMGLFCLYLIRSLRLEPNSLEALALMLSAFGSAVMAFHSLEQFGGPFLFLYQDRLGIRYSLLRRVTVPFNQIQSLRVVREDLEILLPSGSEMVVNLSHLSFSDQAQFLEKLQELVSLPLEG